MPACTQLNNSPYIPPDLTNFVRLKRSSPLSYFTITSTKYLLFGVKLLRVIFKSGFEEVKFCVVVNPLFILYSMRYCTGVTSTQAFDKFSVTEIDAGSTGSNLKVENNLLPHLLCPMMERHAYSYYTLTNAAHVCKLIDACKHN